MTPTIQASRADIDQLFQEQGLPPPPLPDSSGPWLRPGEYVFSTRELETPLFEIARHVNEAAHSSDYISLGFDGHGINSWAMHLYVVQGPLALFLQCRWGNAYDDKVRTRERLEGVLELSAMLQEAASRASIPADERLVVVFSDFVPSGWRWTSTENSEWHEAGDFTLLEALTEITSRSATPKADA